MLQDVSVVLEKNSRVLQQRREKIYFLIADTYIISLSEEIESFSDEFYTIFIQFQSLIKKSFTFSLICNDNIEYSFDLIPEV